jgi:serine protease Do
MFCTALNDRNWLWVASCLLVTQLTLCDVVRAQEVVDAARLDLGKEQARGLAYAFHSAAAKMMPSVVTVLAKSSEVNETLDDLDLLEEEDSSAFNVGSGVIISADGLCVTNNHVIKGSKEIRVRLADGRKMFGKDVVSDPRSDIAVFRILSKEPLSAATIGNSNALTIGDWVMTIGSPFSLDQTVSVGIISSKGRTFSKSSGALGALGALLQTDATINPGNSGGALLDLNGDLVGINTAIPTTSGQFQGIGFAIPMNRVQWIAKELIEHGKVRRAKLGVTVAVIPQYLAEELKIPVRGGVQLTKITAGSPAAKSGMEIGDVILELAGQRIFTPEDFRSLVEQLPADSDYPIKFLRDGKQQTLEIRPVVSE